MMTWGTKRVAGARLLAWAGLGACVLALSACGGSSRLQLSVMRGTSFEHPTYVGVYFLSQESVLDGEPLVDLIDNPDKYTDGVVRKEFVTVYPGDSKSIEVLKPDPRIAWIVVVADFPDTPCARAKQAVKPGSSLALQVDVQDKCIQVSPGK
ncbi:MAG: hypothetical protein R3E12_03480 [Candidatus Eisenbacteria bacterium]|uniref:Type VI secretion lipoprotein TssJ n=1 Tax=Eiseniibacteriota bacterium TaxID=2212470 RepID=A0A956LWP3_UNCEI|nr:type VI secretion lipoprotein TssJ [Candidatus Eisenbacteria bacterium]